MHNNKKAFTVIEIVISLMVVAILMGALAPVLTKKLARNGFFVSKQADRTNEIFLPFDEAENAKGTNYECGSKIQNPDGSEHIVCTLRRIPSVFLSAILVGGGGGGAAASSASVTGETSVPYPFVDSDVQTDSSDGSKYIKRTFPITPTMKNFKITLFGAGGGGAGAAFVDGILVERCPSESLETDNLCITKYNVVDTETQSLPNANNKNISFTLEEDKKLTSTKNQYCYISTYELPGACLANSSFAYVNTPDYPVSGRAVCNWNAANVLCNNLEGSLSCATPGERNQPKSCKNYWRLPNRGELGHTDGNSASSLFEPGVFEEHWRDLNLHRCRVNKSNTKCIGKTKNISSCLYADFIWGEATSPSVGYNAGYWYAVPNINNATGRGGFAGISGDPYDTFAGVRCVIDKYRYFNHSGGGGAAGAYVSDVGIPDNVIAQCASDYNTSPCTLEIFIGKGGEETNGQFGHYVADIDFDHGSLRGKKGGDSKAEVVQYINGSRNVLWGFSADGGAGGNEPTRTDNGSATNQTRCQVKENASSSYGYTSCVASSGANGIAGSQGDGGTYEKVEFVQSTGGPGGAASVFYDDQGNVFDDFGRGGNGGSVTTIDVRSGSEIKGEAGTNGYAMVKYEDVFKGGPGAGGGGGGFNRLESVRITPGEEYTIIIGGGGRGGVSMTDNLNGRNGGATSLLLSSNVYTVGGGTGAQAGSGEIIENGVITGERTVGVQGTGGSGANRGEDGTAGSLETYRSIGGIGGKSGIPAAADGGRSMVSCGGFFVSDLLGCANANNENGFGAAQLNSATNRPGHIYRDGNYGSYGSGGAGGGWAYIDNPGFFTRTGTRIGNGGDGQGGYIYLWW